ncbi:unnamed protein product [Cunninghamella echinulata]
MANASAKKTAASNIKVLANLQKGFLIVNAIYLLWRVGYYWDSFSLKHGILYIITTGFSFVLYNVLKSSGTPSYLPDG